MLAGTPQDYIDKWGGKIGGHLYLRDKGGFERFLPDAYVIGADHDFSFQNASDRSPFLEFFGRDITLKKFIARGSHPHDHTGLVDVIDSIPNLNFSQVDKAARTVRERAARPEVMAYARYENADYDGKIRIMFAEQLRHWEYRDLPGLRGSVVEHPHAASTYIVELVSPSFGNAVNLDRVVVRDGQMVHCMNDGDAVRRDALNSSIFRTGEYAQIVDLYRLVRGSGFIGATDSFQMEYGYTKKPASDKEAVQFFQARLFKPFAEPTFSLGIADDLSRITFGITPPNGIKIPLRVYTGSNHAQFARLRRPYALSMAPSPRQFNMRSNDLSFMPPPFAAFIGSGHRGASLEHLNYRWVQKAPVSILNYREELGGTVRIVSDGLTSIVENA